MTREIRAIPRECLGFPFIKLYEYSEHEQILTFEKLEPKFFGGIFD